MLANYVPRGLIYLFSLFLVLYLIGPQLAAWRSPRPDPDQYECHADDPRDPRRPERLAKRLSERRDLAPVVERLQLTDTGALVHRCEYTAVLDEMISRGDDVPQIVVLYIHGWRHNADDGDTDLDNFTALIHRLDRDEKQASSGRRVVGIYVGWDAATNVPLLDYLTFWPRQLAADRISQSAIVTKLLGAMENIRRLREVESDRIFLMAHSFGARILFASYSQVLLHKTQLAHPGARGSDYLPIRAPADMALLLNPALEASVFTAIDSIRRNKKFGARMESFSREQEPAVVAITTSDDWATKWAFPIGQWLALRRTPVEYTAVGHFEPYQTHSLRERPGGHGSTSYGPSSDWTSKFCEADICLERLDHAQNNPFIVAGATPDVLTGHNGIWDEAFINWTVRFFKKVDSRLAEKKTARRE
jgi:hypothetical protein